MVIPQTSEWWESKQRYLSKWKKDIFKRQRLDTIIDMQLLICRPFSFLVRDIDVASFTELKLKIFLFVYHQITRRYAGEREDG